MTVYVDTMKAPFGRMIMCHMFADTDEELHAMAAKIGVQRKWHQRPPAASWSHYDVCQSKRALAIKHGAVEMQYGRELVEWVRAKEDREFMRDVLGYGPD